MGSLGLPNRTTAAAAASAAGATTTAAAAPVILRRRRSSLLGGLSPIQRVPDAEDVGPTSKSGSGGSQQRNLSKSPATSFNIIGGQLEIQGGEDSTKKRQRPPLSMVDGISS